MSSAAGHGIRSAGLQQKGAACMTCLFGLCCTEASLKSAAYNFMHFSRERGVYRQTRSAEHLMSYEVSCLKHRGLSVAMLAQDMIESGRAAAVPQQSTAPHVTATCRPRRISIRNGSGTQGLTPKGTAHLHNNIIHTRVGTR